MKANTNLPKHFCLISDRISKENNNETKSTIGSKAFNLLKMAELNLPVPPALVIGTHFTFKPEESLEPLFKYGLHQLEAVSGQKFGCQHNPLILSVRSGAPISMPGMMETLLNVGLTDETASGLLRQTGNPRLVWDAYRRLIATFGEVVAGLPAEIFENELNLILNNRDERQLDFDELRTLTRRYLQLYLENHGSPFPQDVKEQLAQAVLAVFKSWDSGKAKEYRKINKIDGTIGTAVTLQKMVFGNSGGHSGAGVGFTRNPSTGEAKLWVDFLLNAQGEDVVSGRRNALGGESLEKSIPKAWESLKKTTALIEESFQDMQDFEFTVQDGVFYILQTRSGKRTPLSAARIAFDLMDAGTIDKKTAISRLSDIAEDDLSIVQLSNTKGELPESLGVANPACNGVVSGEIAFDAKSAKKRSNSGAHVILVRQDAETSDIEALESAVGLLTQRGARTSHAAVVARQLNKVCLVGCSDLRIDLDNRVATFGDQSYQEGDLITLDGNTGNVYPGELKAIKKVDEEIVKKFRALRSSGKQNANPGKSDQDKSAHSKGSRGKKKSSRLPRSED